jgi:hypothetical protein
MESKISSYLCQCQVPVHTPRPFGDCQFLFAVGVSNAGVHIDDFAGFPQGFRLPEGRMALPTETGPSVSVQRFGSFACSGVWLDLFRLTRKAILKQAKRELPSDTVPLRHTGVTTGSGVLYVIENKNLGQPDL